MPCTTPASQLGILHGSCAGVPAFRWYDRELGRILVANKAPPTGAEISRKDFETSIERAVDFVVPLDGKLAIKSAKLGKSFGEAARGTKGGAVLAKLVQQIVAAGDDDEDEPAQGGAAKPASKSGASLLGKLGDLGSLLPKKKAKA